MLNKQEEMNWREQLQTENHTFKFKYSLVKINGKNEVHFEKIFAKGMLGSYSIDELLKEYSIIQHPKTQEIESVENRRMGYVKFKALQVERP